MTGLGARRVVIPSVPAKRRVLHRAEIVRLGGETMGTTWSAQVVVPTGFCIERLRADIAWAIACIVAQMSAWDGNSDLSRFNRAAAGSVQALPGAFFAVLDAALSVAAETGGAFDPTAGALVALWGFGPEGMHGETVDAPSLAAARARCGWRQLRLARDRREARQPGGTIVDLCSIAKGYAVDCLAEVMRANGFGNFLVEIGGELRGEGCKPDGSPWWVRVEAPRSDASPRSEIVIALHACSVATSGDYRRFVDRGGVRHSHTIDPRTGHPADNGVVSVTVLAPTCMRADALSTALMVMGEQDGMAFAEAHGLPALFVLEQGQGLRQSLSPRLAAMSG